MDHPSLVDSRGQSELISTPGLRGTDSFGCLHARSRGKLVGSGQLASGLWPLTEIREERATMGPWTNDVTSLD